MVWLLEGKNWLRVLWLVPVAFYWWPALGDTEELAALGRLFTTAQERTVLDDARHRVLARKGVQQKKSAQGEEDKLEDVTVNGVVVRSGGPPAVWLNGGSALAVAGDLPAGVKLDGVEPGEVMVRLSNGRFVVLSAGQRYDGGVGRVFETFEVVRKGRGDPKTGKDEKNGEARDTPGGATEKRDVEKKIGVSDRNALGKDGEVLSEMIQGRDQFQKRLGGLNSLLGR